MGNPYKTLQERKGSQAGFSLIELAIVLVIIGLIITAVTVGRNTMRNAELNRIYTNGVGPWIQAIYAYYHKTGRLVCNATSPKCEDLLTGAGLVSGGGLSVSYTDSGGNARSVALTSVANVTNNPFASTITLTDSSGQEGIRAVQGYVNGAIADATATTMTFALSQFSSGYQSNM